MKRREGEPLAYDPDKPDDERRKRQGREILQAEAKIRVDAINAPSM